MATAPAATIASDRLFELAGRLERQEGFAEVVASLKAGHAATLDGVWGSSVALAAATLAAHAPGPLLVVCPRAEEVDGLIDDLRLFSRGHAEEFPACESLSGERAIQEEAAGDRLRLLKAMQSPSRPLLVIASIQALLQPVPEREAWPGRPARCVRGSRLRWTTWLAGWPKSLSSTRRRWSCPASSRSAAASSTSLPPIGTNPVRLEFFGDEIESIRRFEIFQPAEPRPPRRGGRHGAGGVAAGPGPSGRLPAAGQLVPAGGAGRVGRAGERIPASAGASRGSARGVGRLWSRCSASLR